MAAEAQPPSPVPSTSELMRGTPLIVWLLVALTGAVALLCTVFYPNYRGPDEVDHVDLSVAMARRTVDWQPGTMMVQQGVASSLLSSSTRLTAPMHLGKDTIPPRGARLSYLALGGAQPTTAINYLVQHPPLYYVVTGSALGIVPHWPRMPFDRIVLYLRIVTALMLIPVPWFCYAAARTLGGHPGIWTAAAATPLMSPQLVHISATVNNDGPVTLLGAATIYVATRALRGDFSRRTAFQLGLLCAAISLVKGFGLVVAFLVVLLYLIGLWRHRSAAGLRRPLVRGALCFLPPVLLASTWWIGNEVMYRRLLPDGLKDPTHQHNPAPRAQTTFRHSGWSFVRRWLDGFSQRFWFDDPTGVQKTRPLHLLAFLLSLFVIAMVVVLLVRPLLDRLFVLAVVLCIAITSIELMRLAWPAFAATLKVGAAQGRYLFALSTAIGLVIAFGLGALLGSKERWVGRVALLLALLVNVAAAADTIHFYWWPKPGVGNPLWQSLQSMLYVSAAPPLLVWLVLLSVLVLSVAVVLTGFAGNRWTRWLRRRPGSISAVVSPAE